MTSLSIERARSEFHQRLIGDRTWSISPLGVASNADSGSDSSKRIAQGLADRVGGVFRGQKLQGQRAGAQFEAACAMFLEQAFLTSAVLPRGIWNVDHVQSLSNAAFLARFAQYAHIGKLARAIEQDRQLEAVLSNAYSIAPDVVVYRRPYGENQLFPDGNGGEFAKLSAMRLRAQALPILHAVISCKWTLRSDRAQNARSEALNLIRNRKGRAPHIVVLTGEPTPGRIASLALGTGDVDMVYHFALPELTSEISERGTSREKDLLATLIEGSRLRDISDLAIDLLA